MTRCPSCAGFKVGDACETCARRRRYGAIVAALRDVDQDMEFIGTMCFDVATGVETFVRSSDPLWLLDALDALAEIMIDRHRLIRAHRKELNAEIQDAQRGASGAYYEGVESGRRGDF